MNLKENRLKRKYLIEHNDIYVDYSLSNKTIENILKHHRKEKKKIKFEQIEELLRPNKPASVCKVMYMNPIEEICHDNFDTYNMSDWVGNLICFSNDENQMASINMQDVILKPVIISNDVIKNMEPPLRSTFFKSFGINFNDTMCITLPLIEPTENPYLVRLAIFFMRYNKENQIKLNYNKGSLSPYSKSVVDTTYIQATLCTLVNANKSVEYFLAVKAYLTLLDMNFYDKTRLRTRGKYDSDYYAFRKDMNRFISKKLPCRVSHVNKMFLPLNCTELVFKEDIKLLKMIFLKIFARFCSNNTSGVYGSNLFGAFNSKLYLKKIGNQLISNFNLPPSKQKIPDFDHVLQYKIKNIDTSQLFTLFGTHVSIRRFLTAKK